MARRTREQRAADKRKDRKMLPVRRTRKDLTSDYVTWVGKAVLIFVAYIAIAAILAYVVTTEWLHEQFRPQADPPGDFRKPLTQRSKV